MSPTYTDRQFNDVYVCWADFNLENITLESESVSEVKLIPFTTFEAMVTQHSAELAPVYKDECKN